MSMATSQVTFYDIASGPPIRPYAPNPWKTRYALNFKRKHANLQYETSWVDLSQVTEVRKRLGALPVRKHAIDDSDFYTLPVIVDSSSSSSSGQTAPTVVGDSFDIALYLDQTYPSTPPLFPPHTQALHRAFNTLVDTLFPEHTLLMLLDMPWDPATAETVKQEFARRAGKTTWSELVLLAEEGCAEGREALLGRFEARLGELATLYKVDTATATATATATTTSTSTSTSHEQGPFLEGAAVPMYADMIVGGWLQWVKASCPEWDDRISTWHGGLWARLLEGLRVYAQED